MIAAAPPPTVATPERVVIVGAGPAGMATAIELAQHGVPSVVLEKRGSEATRQPLFNVTPAFADRLAALDPDGSLVEALTPSDGMRSIDARTGRTGGRREFDAPLDADPSRSRGDMGALLRSAGPPDAAGADTRRWATVGIDDVENALRELARTRHGDLIELRPDSPVESVRQGHGWAEAVLAPSQDGAARDAVRGAMLVDASGRDLLGGPRTTYPERAFWVGARYGADPSGDRSMLRVRDVGPAGPESTLALRSDDRTIVWAQVHEDAAAIDPDRARDLVAERAKLVGEQRPLDEDAPVMPVTVQLWTSDQPAAGRVLKVGDSVRAPYFMTSTGAATALVHDAPRAVDAILAIRDGADVRGTVTAYADAVRSANAALTAFVRPILQRDVGVRPERSPAQPPARSALRTPPTAHHASSTSSEAIATSASSTPSTSPTSRLREAVIT
jgi:2-polyprenyl-6-methoxyphenol hydroxylase-like FAD-dependent oxidoreductase